MALLTLPAAAPTALPTALVASTVLPTPERLEPAAVISCSAFVNILFISSGSRVFSNKGRSSRTTPSTILRCGAVKSLHTLSTKVVGVDLRVISNMFILDRIQIFSTTYLPWGHRWPLFWDQYQLCTMPCSSAFHCRVF